MIREILVSAFTVAGAFFILVAALGVARFPDLLTRMHAATKAGAFGGGLLLVACAIQFAEFWVTAKALAVLIFFYLTAPVAGHLLGRAAYRSGVPLAPQTHRDDLAEENQAAKGPQERR